MPSHAYRYREDFMDPMWADYYHLRLTDARRYKLLDDIAAQEIALERKYPGVSLAARYCHKCMKKCGHKIFTDGCATCERWNDQDRHAHLQQDAELLRFYGVLFHRTDDPHRLVPTIVTNNAYKYLRGRLEKSKIRFEEERLAESICFQEPKDSITSQASRVSDCADETRRACPVHDDYWCPSQSRSCSFLSARDFPALACATTWAHIAIEVFATRNRVVKQGAHIPLVKSIMQFAGLLAVAAPPFPSVVDEEDIELNKAEDPVFIVGGLGVHGQRGISMGGGQRANAFAATKYFRSAVATAVEMTVASRSGVKRKRVPS